MPDPRLRRIRASAGSGKTYELTSRFVALLAAARDDEDLGAACALRRPADLPCGWQEILAITFTNRAAAEMQDRILERLKQIALGRRADKAAEDAPLTPELAKRWLDTVLRRFGALRVRTIDSLLQQIVRMSALDLDLPPDFEPAFDVTDVLAPMLDSLLESARSDPALRALLDSACRDVLFHRPDSRGFTAGGILRAETMGLVLVLLDPALPEPASATILAAQLEALTEAARAAARALHTQLAALNLCVNAHFLRALETCLALRADSKPPDSAMLGKPDLDACLNKASRGQAPAAAMDAYITLREAVAALNSQGRLLRAGLRLAPFVGLARLLAKTLPLALRQEGRVPQQLMPKLALRALSGDCGVPEAFCRMGAALTHLLIDEFQDTSRAQWAALHPLALEALSRGGSLTWVGDVKQAIYGWRDGDARLFDEIAEDPELRAVAPAPLPESLPVNHRSLSRIVLHNNAVFSRLEDPEMARAILRALLPADVGETRLDTEQRLLTQAFAQAEQATRPGRDGGYVRLTTVEGENADALNEATREALISLLRELTARRPCGDVAVLVRANAQAALAAEWLLEADLPVITENSFLLAEHPLVQEGIALLGFINVPEDDAAFWRLIMGDLCAVRETVGRAALEDWLCGQAGRDVPLWRLFQRDFPEAWAAGPAPFCRDAGLISAYDAVSEALNRHAFWQRRPDEAAFAARFLEVLHMAEINGYGSVSAFLDYWDAHGQEERAPMPAAPDAIRVMTIHKAKGLQFPVVIVPWHNLIPRPAGQPLPVRTEDGLTLLAPPNSGMGDTYEALLGAAAREALHLLYVAWTRPREELYAFLPRSPHTARSDAALSLLLKDIPPERGATPGGPLPVMTAPAVTVPAMTAAPAAPEPVIPDDWRPMRWLPELKIFRNPLGELRDAATARGTLAHRCLEHLRLSGDPRADAQNAVRRALAGFPLPLAEAARTELTEALAWFAALPDTARWLAHGTPEQPLTDADGGLYRADLLVDDENGLLVVDYKTGASHPAHAEQVRRYMRLAAAAQPLPVRGMLVYLDMRQLLPVVAA